MTALEFMARNALTVFKVRENYYTLNKAPFAVPSAPLAALSAIFQTAEDAVQAAADELGVTLTTNPQHTYSSQVPRAVIVYGPAGCGKTRNAESIRTLLGVSAVLEEGENYDTTSIKSDSSFVVLVTADKPESSWKLAAIPFSALNLKREPLSHEESVALMEGHEVASEDVYFAARPGLPENHRRTFAAGFARGWEAAQ